MGTFRYTVGGDYNFNDNNEGHYGSYISASPNQEGFYSNSSGIFIDIIGNYISYNEFNADGSEYRRLVNSNGENLYFNNAGSKIDYSGNENNVYVDGGVFGDYLLGGAGDDELVGYDGDDLLVGGGGADELLGEEGVNTASYAGSSSGVTLNLGLGNAAQISAGDASGDQLYDIQNLTGSSFKDTLTGDANANVLAGGDDNDTLRGLGGADTLDGGAGNDRLVINQTAADANGNSGVIIHGGDNVDTLFLQGHDTFKINSNANFDGIEKIYVSDGASLDLSGIDVGVKIISRSTLHIDNTGHDEVTNHITGTNANDTIIGGKGSDYIDGGAGNDVLKGGSAGKGIDAFADLHGGGGNDTLTGVGGNTNLYGDAGNDVLRAGTAQFDFQPNATYLDGGIGDDKMFGNGGEDTFVFQKDFGRDNVYKFTSGKDRFDVSAFVSRTDQIHITELNDGENALVIFDGLGSGNKIIVHNVAEHPITTDDFVLTATVPHDGSYGLPF